MERSSNQKKALGRESSSGGTVNGLSRIEKHTGFTEDFHVQTAFPFDKYRAGMRGCLAHCTLALWGDLMAYRFG